MKYAPKLGKVAWEKGDERYIMFYSGEVLNGKPHGKGICEIHFFIKNVSSAYKSSYHDNFWKKYSKDFIYNSRGYFLWKKYIGEWKFGKRDGYINFCEFADPGNDRGDNYPCVNRYGGPMLLKKKVGNFKNNKEYGKFEIFDAMYGWASINYKNGRVIGNPIKIKKKLDPNTNRNLKKDELYKWTKDKLMWTSEGDYDFK